MDRFGRFVVVVTGAAGQLGRELAEIAAKGATAGNKERWLFTAAREDWAQRRLSGLDITDRDAAEAFLRDVRADVLVNCAAYTDVERAEQDSEAAYLVNAEAPAWLAEICRKLSVFMIHVSTDYVFDGRISRPYREDDIAAPLSVYGASKLQGERAVAEILDGYMVLRTAWLYSRFGRNFVTKMLDLFATKDCVRVVNDQVGTPTNAADLAGFIYSVIKDRSYRKHPGLYHYTDEGVCSWYDFAKAVSDLSDRQCRVLPCTSQEFPVKARRPAFSVLDKSLVKRTFGIEIPYWRDSLSEMMARMMYEVSGENH